MFQNLFLAIMRSIMRSLSKLFVELILVPLCNYIIKYIKIIIGLLMLGVVYYFYQQYNSAKFWYEVDHYAVTHLDEYPCVSHQDSIQRLFLLREAYLDSVSPKDHLKPHFSNYSDHDYMDLALHLDVEDMLLRTARNDHPLYQKMVRNVLKMTDMKKLTGEKPRNRLDEFYSIFIRLFGEETLLETYENFNKYGGSFYSLRLLHRQRLDERYEEALPIFMKRLNTLGIDGSDNEDLLRASGKFPFQRYVTINQLGSPELIPKILRGQRLFEIYKTKDAYDLPTLTRVLLFSKLKYRSDLPHILGYVTSLAEKKEIAQYIEKNHLQLPEDCRLMWSFAKERTGNLDDNGEEIYGYALYVVGEKPNDNGTGLCYEPVSRFTTFFDLDGDASVSSADLVIKISLKPEMEDEWNYFTLTNKKKYFILSVDDEVLYSPYIEWATNDTDIICPENHRLRDCAYIYAFLKGDGYRYDYIDSVEVEDMDFYPLDESFVENPKEYLTWNIVIFLVYTCIAWYLAIRKKNKETGEL